MGLRRDLRAARAPVLAFAGMGVAWGAFAALVPVLKARIEAPDALFGLLLTFSAAGLALALWTAPLMDRRAGPQGMRAGMALLAAACLGPGLAGGPAAFGLAMLAMALASGLLDVVMNTRLSEAEARTGRPLMNLGHAAFSFAYAGAALATGLAREGGWAPWAVFAAAALAVLTLSTGGRAAPERPEEGTGGRAHGLPLWLMATCGALVLLAFAIEGGVEQWSALHVERTLGGGAAEGALGPAVLGLTMGAGRLGGQLAARRVPGLRLAVPAGVAAAAGAFVAAAAPTPGIAYLGFGLLGLGVSVIGPLGIAEAGARARPGGRGAAVGRVAVIGFGGFFLGPPLLGAVSEAFGLPWAIATLGLAALGAAALALGLGRVAKPGRAA
ncbi:cyanate permease [Hasllibacter halocynthiae]|uniref:Cyanate permease n=1 Tax=Hasllibacter halocynthiae TaxID=595589 RepID=A0A2T0X4B5_9RHOB|nr:MFS transporter [Hasllibacter halocynthiae]PRY93782.1 cyanate permease [Hasllibacter halocynthiae]